MDASAIARKIGHYLGKAQTLLNQRRAERILNALPPHLRKDIGWPDCFTRSKD